MPVGDQLLLTTPSPKRPSMLVHIRPQTRLPSSTSGPQAQDQLETPKSCQSSAPCTCPVNGVPGSSGDRDGVTAPSCPHVPPVLQHHPAAPARRPGPAISVCNVLAPAAVRPPPPGPVSAPLPCFGLAHSLHTIPLSTAEDPASSACTFLVGCEDSFPRQEFSERCFRITPLRPQSDRDSVLYMR